MPHKIITQMSAQKKTWIMIVVGAALLLMGSVYGSDWMNYFNKTSSLYPAIAKPCITLLGIHLNVDSRQG